MVPGRLLCHFLSLGRFFPILDQSNQGCVIRKLEKLDRGVCGGAVVSVERVQERGEYTALRCSYAEGQRVRDVLSQPHCQEIGDTLTEGFRHSQLGEFGL